METVKIPYTKELKKRIRRRVMSSVGHLLAQKSQTKTIKDSIRAAVFEECGVYDEIVIRRATASLMSTRGMRMKRAGITPRANFYRTPEWLHLRYVTLLKYGAKCACCGRSASDDLVIQVDHIKPKSIHPELALDPDNLQPLCEECNEGKSNWDETRWIA